MILDTSEYIFETMVFYIHTDMKGHSFSRRDNIQTRNIMMDLNYIDFLRFHYDLLFLLISLHGIVVYVFHGTIHNSNMFQSSNQNRKK